MHPRAPSLLGAHRLDGIQRRRAGRRVDAEHQPHPAAHRQRRAPPPRSARSSGSRSVHRPSDGEPKPERRRRCTPPTEREHHRLGRELPEDAPPLARPAPCGCRSPASARSRCTSMMLRMPMPPTTSDSRHTPKLAAVMTLLRVVEGLGHRLVGVHLEVVRRVRGLTFAAHAAAARSPRPAPAASWVGSAACTLSRSAPVPSVERRAAFGSGSMTHVVQAEHAQDAAPPLEHADHLEGRARDPELLAQRVLRRGTACRRRPGPPPPPRRAVLHLVGGEEPPGARPSGRWCRSYSAVAPVTMTLGCVSATAVEIFCPARARSCAEAVLTEGHASRMARRSSSVEVRPALDALPVHAARG